ncbi:hypothetical protein SORBI_3005G050900 [Sorghum bicolor]|uniref:Uncharacterized protein n=2 Tax=Sorghum bicolor TaxID=4558 RepID=A0A1B6PQ76_SORBI|nr:hypothetical protein SORBI_3005G050900 [Sorghum bicolor]
MVKLPAATVENQQSNCVCGSPELDSEKRQGYMRLQPYILFTCMKDGWGLHWAEHGGNHVREVMARVVKLGATSRSVLKQGKVSSSHSSEQGDKLCVWLIKVGFR